MKVLQWSMTIPRDKQEEFVKWFHEVAGPTFTRFGAKSHQLYKVEDQEVIGRQFTETNRFIEHVYFDDNFDIPIYFENVRNDANASKLSRMYEEVFEASDIELRVLEEKD